MKRIAIRLMVMPDTGNTGQSVVAERAISEEALAGLASPEVYKSHLKPLLVDLVEKVKQLQS